MSEKLSTTKPASDGGKVATARHWDPTDLYSQLQTEFDQFWNERWPSPRLLRRTMERAGARVPRMDMYEQDGTLVVKAELPGVKKEDIQVELDDSDLVIRGERRSEEKSEGKDYFRMERSYGEFYRRLPLPEGIQAEKMTATYKDGVLEISVPVAELPKPEATKIAVK